MKMSYPCVSSGGGRKLTCVGAWSVLLAGLALVAPAVLAQVRPTHRPDLPNFDNRTAAAPSSAEAAEQQRGKSHLSALLPTAVVDFDYLLGTPQFIRANDGFL